MVVIVGQSAAHKNQYVTQSPRFNIYSKRFPGKQNVSTDNVFLNSQLFIQYPGDLFLPAISLPLLPRFAITCNCKSASKVKLSLQVTLMDLLGNTCFLQQVQKVTSVSSDWLILIRVVYFFCGNYD